MRDDRDRGDRNCWSIAGACRHRGRRRSYTGAAMFKPPILQRLLVGSWLLITINTLIFGFVIFLPQFFLRQGLTITNSLGYTVVLGCGIAGRLRARRLSVGRHRAAVEHHHRFGLYHRVRLDLCTASTPAPIQSRCLASAPS